MRVVVPLAIATGLLACLSGCAAEPVRVARYRGAYSTHFEGIPDQAEACALVRNDGTRPVEWLELRMRSRSSFATGHEHPLRSTWVYRGHIEAGAVVALRFVRPPFADELDVRVSRTGTDHAGPASGRPMVRVDECSDGALQAVLRDALRGSTAPGLELRAASVAEPDPAQSLVAAP
ncbi:MAG TPA: hypothetical protein VMR31_00940 [Myxococcota bacterium]|nr:hypothetical protein [Myxococcota bacterium]